MGEDAEKRRDENIFELVSQARLEWRLAYHERQEQMHRTFLHLLPARPAERCTMCSRESFVFRGEKMEAKHYDI